MYHTRWAWEYYELVKPPMLLCSNKVVLLFWPIMIHFCTKNASAIRQRTCIVGVKTWIIKNIGTLHTFGFLQISAGISALNTFKMLANSCWACFKLISVLSGPSENVIPVDELGVIGISIHIVLELCSHSIQINHTFLGENPVLCLHYAMI